MNKLTYTEFLDLDKEEKIDYINSIRECIRIEDNDLVDIDAENMGASQDRCIIDDIDDYAQELNRLGGSDYENMFITEYRIKSEYQIFDLTKMDDDGEYEVNDSSTWQVEESFTDEQEAKKAFKNYKTDFLNYGKNSVMIKCYVLEERSNDYWEVIDSTDYQGKILFNTYRELKNTKKIDEVLNKMMEIGCYEDKDEALEALRYADRIYADSSKDFDDLSAEDIADRIVNGPTFR